MWTRNISPSRKLYEQEARGLHGLIFEKQMGPRDSSTRISSIFPRSGKIKPPGTVSTSTPFLGPHPHFTPNGCTHNIL